jgi:HEAT repeat protein
MLWWTLRRLRSSDAETRKRTTEKLVNSGNPKAVKVLIAALEDSNEDVRHIAEKALVRIGKVAVEPLSTSLLLRDSGRQARRHIARALAEIGDARAIQTLITICNLPAEVVRIYAEEDLVAPLIAALKDSDKQVAKNAAVALGTFCSVRAVEPLIVAYKDNDSNLSSSAEKALIKIAMVNMEVLKFILDRSKRVTGRLSIKIEGLESCYQGSHRWSKNKTDHECKLCGETGSHEWHYGWNYGSESDDAVQSCKICHYYRC